MFACAATLHTSALWILRGYCIILSVTPYMAYLPVPINSSINVQLVNESQFLSYCVTPTVSAVALDTTAVQLVLGVAIVSEVLPSGHSYWSVVSLISYIHSNDCSCMPNLMSPMICRVYKDS